MGLARTVRSPSVRWLPASRWLSGLLAVALASGCAARRFTPPTDPAEPAPDASAAWAEATSGCRDVRTLRATLRLSARAGNRRVPTVRVGVALDDGRAIALEAQSFFTLRGTAEQATLVLRDGRFVRAAVADLVQALIDVRLDPARLLAILTGCLTPRPEFLDAVRRGEWLVVTTNDAMAYLGSTDEMAWAVRAGTFDGLQVDYRRRGPRWPRDLQITSAPGTSGSPVSIAISDLEIGDTNAPIPPGLTQPIVPAGATEISLDDLRRILGGDGNE